MNIPTAYIDGYAKGREVDPERAENYVAHTRVTDPLAEAMVADLLPLGEEESSRWIEAGMVGDDEVLRTAPGSVREFFASCAEPPEWVDLPSFLPGCRMFHRNTKLILAGMVAGVLIEGFATNIAQSFFLTGRLRYKGVRRLKQNNRHMVEIFMPGGMERHADGWVYSIRVRLVHARLRHLIGNSSEWDFRELGLPLSAAHLGFAVSSFSARLLQHLKSLGGSFNEEERKKLHGCMAVLWLPDGYSGDDPVS